MSVILFGRHQPDKSLRCPTDTLLKNDVVIMSKRRYFDVIPSKWRRFDVITTLSLLQVFSGYWRVSRTAYGRQDQRFTCVALKENHVYCTIICHKILQYNYHIQRISPATQYPGPQETLHTWVWCKAGTETAATFIVHSWFLLIIVRILPFTFITN